MRINPHLANQMYLNSGDEDKTCLSTGTYTGLAAAKYIKNNDKDGDKCLSADEVTLSAEAFAKLDADKDGKVTLEEMKKSLAGKDNEIYQYYKNGGATAETPDITTALLNNSNTSSTASGTYSSLAAKRYLAEKDKNGDGVLSSDEVSLTAEIFTKMDANGDGKVTSAELNSVLSSKDSAIKKYYQNGGTGTVTDLTSTLLAKI
jgi:Ca2+-binding EF-hand superfamily protein